MNTAFPQALVQTCIIHLIRNTFHYASRKYAGPSGWELTISESDCTEGILR